MSSFKHIVGILFLIILLLHNSTQSHSHSHNHTKRIPTRRSASPPVSSATFNTSHTEFSEQQFMKWVNFVGRLRHSLFEAAINKLFPSYTLTVSKNPNTGDFTTIQSAIDSLPFINLVRVVIKIKPGTYTEKVSIPPFKSFITIEGAGADKTIVQWGDTAKTIGSKGQPLGTYSSATFAVNSPYFIAKNITFKNTTPLPTRGAMGVQAVAFRISADTAAFLGCRFLGAQDTLYDHFGRHYYKDCYIEGSVDFIFGNALSLFEGCHVHAIAQNYGALTAQGRKSLLQDTGFSFVNCKVTGSGALYLGRAWGSFSTVIFAYTYMDNIIIPKGWYNWGDPNREIGASGTNLCLLGPVVEQFSPCRLHTAASIESLLPYMVKTVFYGQYKCTGPGASYAGRVSWSRELTAEEAKPFLSLSFIDGSEWVKL